MEHVWGYNFDPQINVVEARMCRLRDKVDKPFGTNRFPGLQNDNLAAIFLWAFRVIIKFLKRIRNSSLYGYGFDCR
jgi:hypothetical protein